MAKVWEYFENLNEYVYVSDVETYELIYMNKKTREFAGLLSEADYRGKMCYEVIHKCSAPCSMCNNSALEEGQFREWWYYNPAYDKSLSMKDTVVLDGGRRCRMEIAVDLISQQWKSNISHGSLEALANEILRVALQKGSPDESVGVFLEYLGKALGGQRTFVFELNDHGSIDNTYEWVAFGSGAQRGILQNIPLEFGRKWYEQFKEKNYVMINDPEEIRESTPEIYDILTHQNIRSLCVVPLICEGKPIGFYGVDSPSGKYVDSASDILQMMAYFITASLRRRDVIKKLKKEESERMDLSYQRRMSITLAQRTQEYLDMVNDIIGSGLWYMEFDELGNMTRVFWSDVFRKMLGFENAFDFPERLESWSDRLHPEDKEEVLRAYWDCVSGKSGYDIKYRLMKRSGEYNWFHARGKTSCYPNGRTRLFLGTFINITDEVMSQRAVEEAYRAANRANSAKTEFLASMSHDIRTPLNAIIGMTALAAYDIDDRDKVRHCLDNISESSNYLLGLVNTVLDMNKIESGKFNLNIEPFDIAELISGFVEISRPLTINKRQKFIVDRPELVHTEVLGDKEQIRRCLMNFMSNATKYTDEGGTIRFSVSEKPTNLKSRGCYEFVFEDNGIGMSEEFIPKLFEPFTRANDERAAKEQGTGLGMPITQNLIRMMNGDIKVESRINEGSRFVISIFLELCGEGEEHRDILNAVTGKRPEEALRDFEDTDLGEYRVLLAEDNEINAEIATEILGMTGLNVEHAWNGQEAAEMLEKAEDGYYDLVFMDIQMPIMDGYEATKRIRASERGHLRDIPIIAMSANAFAEDVHHSKSIGMNEHIAKPLNFETLLAVLKKWLT